MVSLGLETQKTTSWKMFNRIAHRYDLLNRLLSGGIDVYWRKKLRPYLSKETPNRLLDIATGTGDVIFTLKETKGVTFDSLTGVDMSEEMLRVAEQKQKQRDPEHKISFNVGDAQKLEQADNSQTHTTIAFGIRNIPDVRAALNEMYRVLDTDGTCLVLEFSIPSNIIFRSIYLFYFRYILPFVGSVISGDQKAYSYLNQTVEDFPYGDTFVKLLEHVGFKEVTCTPLTFGIASIYKAKK